MANYRIPLRSCVNGHAGNAVPARPVGTRAHGAARAVRMALDSGGLAN